MTNNHRLTDFLNFLQFTGYSFNLNKDPNNRLKTLSINNGFKTKFIILVTE